MPARPLQLAPAVDPIDVRAARVATVAAQWADDVDRRGRFPAEALAAAKAERLLGVMAPPALGGEDASCEEVIDACFRLGRACASAGLIFAMHQVKAACIIRHSAGSVWHTDFLTRLCREQFLLASSTTEGQGGGNVRSSEAPIERQGDKIRLRREASVISYGETADAVVTTARRCPDAVASDQVLVVLEKRDYSLTRTGGWDTLGMRGTVSAGFRLEAVADPAQVMPQPYERIHRETMTPCAHLYWSAVWAGIAASATERARRHLAKSARSLDGKTPPAALHLFASLNAFRSLRARITAAAKHYERLAGDESALSAMDFQTAITALKVDASELAVTAVTSALRACGLAGFRNDGEASLGRHLRDVLSAPIMISNDRILATLAGACLLNPLPESLSD